VAKKRSSKAQVPPESVVSDSVVAGIAQRRREVAEAVYTRLQKIALVMIERWENRVLNDDGYQPTPKDLKDIFETVREMEELMISHAGLDRMLADLKRETARIEEKLLNLLFQEPGG